MKKILYLLLFFTSTSYGQLESKTYTTKEIYNNKLFKQKITITKSENKELYSFSFMNSQYRILNKIELINFSSNQNCLLFFEKLLEITKNKKKNESEMISIDNQEIFVNYLKVANVEGVYLSYKGASTSIKEKHIYEMMQSIKKEQ